MGSLKRVNINFIGFYQVAYNRYQRIKGGYHRVPYPKGYSVAELLDDNPLPILYELDVEIQNSTLDD